MRYNYIRHLLVCFEGSLQKNGGETVNDDVAYLLKNIIIENGIIICNNIIKLKSLLFDLSGENRKEIYILMTALRHNIVEDILNISKSEIDDFSYFRMVSRLCEEASTLKLPTGWAVKAWIEALGKSLSCESYFSKVVLRNPRRHIFNSEINVEILKRNGMETYDEYSGRIQGLGYIPIGKVILMEEQHFEIRWNDWVEELKLVENKKDFIINVNKEILKLVCGKFKEFILKGKLTLKEGNLNIKEISLNVLGDKEEFNLKKYIEKGW